jgi:hypothetical protein
MAICTVYNNTGLSAEKYAETLKRLESAGAGQPKGQLYHVCFGDTENLSVVDVFESREAYEEFGQVLKPILEDLDLGQPEVSEVHKVRG